MCTVGCRATILRDIAHSGASTHARARPEIDSGVVCTNIRVHTTSVRTHVYRRERKHTHVYGRERNKPPCSIFLKSLNTHRPTYQAGSDHELPKVLDVDAALFVPSEVQPRFLQQVNRVLSVHVLLSAAKARTHTHV